MAAASATPAIMLLAGAGFFGLSLAANQGISVLGMDPAAMAFAGVAAGAVTQVHREGGRRGGGAHEGVRAAGEWGGGGGGGAGSKEGSCVLGIEPWRRWRGARRTVVARLGTRL